MTYTTLLHRLDPSLAHQEEQDGRPRRSRQDGWHVHRVPAAERTAMLDVTKELATGERVRLRVRVAA